MTKLFSLLAASCLAAAPAMAQTGPCASNASTPTPAPSAGPTTTSPQIDCSWLSVDTTAKTATFQLVAGLTNLNGGLNFNGFNEGKLLLTVPVNWTVAIHFANKDQNLTHSAEVVDSVNPIPPGPGDPAFPRAMTQKLMVGLSAGQTDSMSFVASKPGTYLIFCGVPGHGIAGMWLRLTVSPTEKRPTLTASTS